jgi:4-methoxybenzoate monooxygenase (O-demethylating)
MTPPLVLSDRVPSGCLARFPEQFAKLRTDPGLARTAFGEAVRYETPVQTFFRTTTRPVEIHGIELGKGEKVLMFLGAAKRDPRRWVRPDEYDISRRTIGHVGFGSGIHQCVGSLLARLEGECMLIPSIGEMQDIKESLCPCS